LLNRYVAAGGLRLSLRAVENPAAESRLEAAGCNVLVTQARNIDKGRRRPNVPHAPLSAFLTHPNHPEKEIR